MDQSIDFSLEQVQPTGPPVTPLSNDSLISWITRAEPRPAKYTGTEGTGLFRVCHFTATTPPQTKQFPGSGLQAGDSLRCWLTIEGEGKFTRFHCFAGREVADQLEEWPEGVLLSGTLVCLGQMKVYAHDWAVLDEDRGVEYHTAWLIKSAQRAQSSAASRKSSATGGVSVNHKFIRSKI